MSNTNISNGVGFGKTIFYFAVICLAGIILFKFFQNSDVGVPDILKPSKKVQVNYVPAEYDLDLDGENAMAILANPYRYRREFNSLVKDINLSLLHHVANRMNLADSLKMTIEEKYEEHHPYLRQLYFNDFVALQDSSGSMYEAWYNNESTQSIDILNEITGKYTCFLVNHVITSMIATKEGSFLAKGSKMDTPCGIAMTEGLQPMIKRLSEEASIRDFSASKGLIEQKVEKVIAELATVEIQDKKAINKQLQTKVFGFSVSSTDIEVSAISLLKVGFKLDRLFGLDIKPKSKKVVVTLPQPTVLSHEVFPKIDKLDIGWMREVKEIDLNKNFNALRREFRKEAIEDKVMEKAKTQAKEIMNMMLGPMVSSIDNSYQLAVVFKGLHPEMEADFDETENTEAYPEKASLPF